MKRPVTAGMLAISLLLAAFTDIAAKTARELAPDKTVLLYPKGQLVDEGIVESGKEVTLGPNGSNSFHEANDIDSEMHYTKVGDEACLMLYFPKKCNGKMMVICPGGGYRFLSGRTEGRNVVRWCLSHNIAACLLLYRMPEGNPLLPVRDVQNAMRYCRHHSADWGVKEIGVIGFSAGGHLAACASTLFPDEVTRPDFAVLVYAYTDLNTEGFSKSATNCTWHFTHGDRQKKDYYSMHARVSDQTPPTLLFISEDDDKVDTWNSLEYYSALREHKVPCELHIIGEGKHGWGFPPEAPGVDKLPGNLRQAVLSTLESWLERY